MFRCQSTKNKYEINEQEFIYKNCSLKFLVELISYINKNLINKLCQKKEKIQMILTYVIYAQITDILFIIMKLFLYLIDLFILDYEMPVMNGYEAAEEIRAMDTEYAKDIIIFTVTAEDDEESVSKIFASGIDRYFLKPVNVKEILKELLKKSKEENEKIIKFFISLVYAYESIYYNKNFKFNYNLINNIIQKGLSQKIDIVSFNKIIQTFNTNFSNIHKDIAEKFLPMMAERFKEHNVRIYGCDRTREILGDGIEKATEVEYETEFLDYTIAVKVVEDVKEAVEHIRKYSTKHSECIVTKSLENAEYFQKCVDAAAVYVNASTRFTDGGEFGFGAEIGISTQKLHARGPMALPELTSTKYLVNGNGQVRG